MWSRPMIPGSVTGVPVKYSESFIGTCGRPETKDPSPSPCGGEVFTPAVKGESPLIPAAAFRKTAFTPSPESPSQAGTDSPGTPEQSFRCTEAAAGAVSNSALACIAVQSLPAPSPEAGKGAADSETLKQRESQWSAKQKEIDRLADGLGMGLDDGIKNAVIALQVNGFETRQSCEGHIDWGCGAPWIDIEDPDAPGPLFGQKGNSIFIMNRFNGHEEAFRRVASENGITVEELMDRKNFDRYSGLRREAETSVFGNAETAEFSAWRQRNRELRKDMDALLEEYYTAKNVPESQRIQFLKCGDDSFRIYTGTEKDLFRDRKSMSDSDKQALGERLAEYRKAMAEFTSFMKERFMAAGPAVTGH
ncbi:MAG: hypothetical protein AB2L14_37110 [Candidatus Xenobiia bacterium LiM19]